MSERETTVGALTAADLGSVVTVSGAIIPLASVSHWGNGTTTLSVIPGMGSATVSSTRPCAVTTPDAVAEGGQR